MHIAFYKGPKERCQQFADVFHAGLLIHGDTISVHSVLGEFDHPADAIVLSNVRRKEIFDYAADCGIPVLYIDKGYTRGWGWRRIAVNGCEPGPILGLYDFPDDRRIRFGWLPKPWRKQGDHIILASASLRAQQWRNLPSPEQHATEVVEQLRKYTDRPIVHRCKPSERVVYTVPGTIHSPYGRKAEVDLVNAHALVTVGSGIVLESVLTGIPTVVLGDAVMVSLSSTKLSEIEDPRLASEDEIIAVLNDLAYHQWSVDEFETGRAWTVIKRLLINEVL